jgi:hypothetical protein
MTARDPRRAALVPLVTGSEGEGHMLGLRARLLPAALLAAVVAAGCSNAANHPPAVTLTAAPAQAAPGGTVTVAAAASDPDGDKLTFAWDVPAGWTAVGGTDTAVVQLTAPAAYAEAALVSVTVSDPHGGKTSAQALVSTEPGAAPTFANVSATPNPLVPGGQATLVALAKTSPGGTLTYTWTISDPAWQIAGAAETAVVTAPTRYGAAAAAVVVADDGKGNQATARVTLSTVTSASPVIEQLTADPPTLNPAAQATLTAQVAHPLNLAMTYAWTVADSAWTITGTGPTATLTAPNALSQSTLVTLTVTDAAGASTRRSIAVATVDVVEPVPVIAGTPPLHGVVDAPVALDGSGSYSPVGHAIQYRWWLLDGPTDATVTWLDPDGITVLPLPEEPKVLLQGDKPGAYTVALGVYDAGTQFSTGAHYAQTQIVLDGDAQIVVVSGDAQTGTVNQDLPQPLVVKVQTSGASPAPVPGVQLGWSVAGGTLFPNPALTPSVTDANGEAWIGLRPSRIAGGGTVRVWLKRDPAITKTLTFTAAADKAAYIAAVTDVGTTDQGFNVKVQTVDQYGNLALDNTANNGASFQLDIFGSTTAAFTQNNGTHFNGTLLNGQFQTAVTDTKREVVRVVISPGTTGVRDLPFAYVFPLVNDNAELGLRGYNTYWGTPNWTLAPSTAGLPSWNVAEAPGDAQSGGRAFGLALSPSQAIAQGSSDLVQSPPLTGMFVGATPSMWRLDLSTKIQLTSAHDSDNACTRQPKLTVGTLSGSTFTPATPQSGYPVVDLCQGGESLGATSGYVPLSFDLTGLVGGNAKLDYRLEQPSDPSLLPAQPVSWLVDDARLTVMVAASALATGARAYFLPGAAKGVELAGGGSAVVYGSCPSGDNANVIGSIVDAHDNVTQDGTLAFEIDWNGTAWLSSVNQGSLVEAGPARALVRFDGGQAQLSVGVDAAATLRFTLANPFAYPGITLGTYLDVTAQPWISHSNGIGDSWCDHTTDGTMSATQARRACEARYGAGACTTNASDAYRIAGYAGCVVEYLWTYAGVSTLDPCGQLFARSPGDVSEVYWLTTCSCSGGVVGVNPYAAWPHYRVWH